jgi:hypothetical protein
MTLGCAGNLQVGYGPVKHRGRATHSAVQADMLPPRAGGYDDRWRSCAGVRQPPKDPASHPRRETEHIDVLRHMGIPKEENYQEAGNN